MDTKYTGCASFRLNVVALIMIGVRNAGSCSSDLRPQRLGLRMKGDLGVPEFGKSVLSLLRSYQDCHASDRRDFQSHICCWKKSLICSLGAKSNISQKYNGIKQRRFITFVVVRRI